MIKQIFLPPKQAAAWLQLSVRTLEKWRSQGVGPRFHRFGNRIRYHIDDLAAWTEQTVHVSTSL